MQIAPHEMTFTTKELELIACALDILQPEDFGYRKILDRLQDEVREELYQNREE